MFPQWFISSNGPRSLYCISVLHNLSLLNHTGKPQHCVTVNMTLRVSVVESLWLKPASVGFTLASPAVDRWLLPNLSGSRAGRVDVLLRNTGTSMRDLHVGLPPPAAAEGWDMFQLRPESLSPTSLHNRPQRWRRRRVDAHETLFPQGQNILKANLQECETTLQVSKKWSHVCK